MQGEKGNGEVEGLLLSPTGSDLFVEQSWDLQYMRRSAHAGTTAKNVRGVEGMEKGNLLITVCLEVVDFLSFREAGG